MAVMTIRGLDERMVKALKNLAKERGHSLNTTLLEILKERLGFKKKPRSVTHHDLDSLAGTWTASEYAEFTRKIGDFEKIDESLWK